METIRSIWNGLDWSYLTDILLRVIPALICITLHELAHGFVAYRLGDTTAKDAGRLTLNPVKHLDVIGLLMLVVFRFGWAKPVPVNMNRFEDPKKGMAITAVAGPLMNVAISMVFLFLYGVIIAFTKSTGDVVTDMVLTTAYLSISLAIFNILPVSPLDGSKVLFALLPQRYYNWLMRYERYGMILLLALSWAGILGRPLNAVTQAAFDKLFIFAEWGYELFSRLA